MIHNFMLGRCGIGKQVQSRQKETISSVLCIIMRNLLITLSVKKGDQNILEKSIQTKILLIIFLEIQ